MIKAIVANGVIVPRDRLPDTWQEGTEVAVEKCNGDAQPVFDSTDTWMDEMEAIARQGDCDDDTRLALAIESIRRREKELARKGAGLLSCPYPRHPDGGTSYGDP